MYLIWHCLSLYKQKARPYTVILEPGQVLYVPRHWWHFVESLEDSISVNMWIEMVKICTTEKHAYSRMPGTSDLD